MEIKTIVQYDNRPPIEGGLYLINSNISYFIANFTYDGMYFYCEYLDASIPIEDVDWYALLD